MFTIVQYSYILKVFVFLVYSSSGHTEQYCHSSSPYFTRISW